MILNTAIWQQVIAEAQAKASEQPRWLRAIERGAVEIERARYWSFDGVTLTLISTTSGRRYKVDREHICQARAGICKHRAARRLIQRYVVKLAEAEGDTDEADSQSAAIASAASEQADQARRVTLEGALPQSVQPDHNCKLCFKPLKHSEHEVHTLCALYESHSDEIAEFAAQVKVERATYRRASNDWGETFNGMQV